MNHRAERSRPTALLLAAALALPTLAAAAPDEAEVEKRVEKKVEKIDKKARHVWVTGDEGEPKSFHFALGGGFLGVELTRLTPELRTHFGAPEDAGVMIARVTPDSPAAAAGMRVGDVVTAIDGEPVDSTGKLGSEVRRRKEGDRVRLDVYRDGRLQAFDVTIAERERQAFDVGEFLEWREGEEPRMLRIAPRIDLMEKIQLDPQVLENLGDRLGAIDWTEMTRTIQRIQPELEARLKELEERLKELEAELERATREKP